MVAVTMPTEASTTLPNSNLVVEVCAYVPINRTLCKLYTLIPYRLQETY